MNPAMLKADHLLPPAEQNFEELFSKSVFLEIVAKFVKRCLYRMLVLDKPKQTYNAYPSVCVHEERVAIPHLVPPIWTVWNIRGL